MNKHSKKSVICRISAFLLVLMVLLSALGMTASAEGIQRTTYDTYTYWASPGSRWTVSSTPMYELDQIINASTLGISNFSDPNDIFTDSKGLVYLMDSGNGRIVVLNADYSLKTIIDSATYNGESITFTGAKGVYVTKNNKIYICDTENARVLILGTDNVVEDILTLPDADVIPSDFSYRPIKVAVDSNGYTYVLSEGSYYGALLYKPDGTFSGFYGANSVKTSILGVFKRIYEMIFVSDVKRESSVKELPYTFNDLAIDSSDFVYTTTGATSTNISEVGQLKKLSPGGTNVLKNKAGTEVKSAQETDFSDMEQALLLYAGGSYQGRVTDICTMDVDSYGYMYCFCRAYGHAFIYDQSCNVLGVFGGGISSGQQQGIFNRACSMHVNDKNQDILIVDPANNNVTIYKETEYGALVKKAQSLTNDGSYTEAKEYWEKALKYDRNLQLAYRGLARAALVEEDYETCIEYAKMGFDQDTYAQAYKYVRNDFLSTNFVWIFILTAIVVLALVFFMVYTNKHEVQLVKNKKLSTMFRCIFHPFQGAQQVRYYGNGSIALATGCMVVFFFSLVTLQMNKGFAFNMFDKSSYNVVFPLIESFGIVVLWALANWGMSTLFEGKGKIKDVYIVTCYALIPLIINNVAQVLLSNVLTPEEELVMNVINVICIALFGIVLCVGTMTVHEFGFFKFLVMTLVTVFAMFIVVFVILMVLVLIQQLITFASTIYKEVTYR